ncbi:MAG TPA: hypothetical protein V6C65_08220, partial [Allocoleopsis sp.]
AEAIAAVVGVLDGSEFSYAGSIISLGSVPWGKITDFPGFPSVPISALIAAASTNTIDNLEYVQEWQWNTLSGTALKLSTTSSTSGSTFSTARKLLDISMAGSFGNTARTTYAAVISNTTSSSASASNNTALYITTSGASTDYGVYSTVSSTSSAGIAVGGYFTATHTTVAQAYAIYAEAADASAAFYSPTGRIIAGNGTTVGRPQMTISMANTGSTAGAITFGGNIFNGNIIYLDTTTAGSAFRSAYRVVGTNGSLGGQSQGIFDVQVTQSNTAFSLIDFWARSTRSAAFTASHYGFLAQLTDSGTTNNATTAGIRGEVTRSLGTGSIYGGYFQATGTGSTSTSYGVYATATGGSLAWAGWFDGFTVVRRGGPTPEGTSELEVIRNGFSSILINSTTAGDAAALILRANSSSVKRVSLRLTEASNRLDFVNLGTNTIMAQFDLASDGLMGVGLA